MFKTEFKVLVAVVVVVVRTKGMVRGAAAHRALVLPEARSLFAEKSNNESATTQFGVNFMVDVNGVSSTDLLAL